MNACESFLRLNAEIVRIEPQLSEVLRCNVSGGAEGLELRSSVCGFASNVLAKYINHQKLAMAVPKMGMSFGENKLIPKRMRRHVLVETEAAMLDPTWGQFMTLVGLDTRQAAAHDTLKKLYPERRVAVIPRGTERVFGERFASFALEKILKIRAIRGSEGLEHVPEDACAWMEEQEAFEVLADIWNPERYETFDNAGDGETPARQALERLCGLLDKGTI